MSKSYLLALGLGAIIGAALIHFLYPRIEEKVEFKDRIVTETKVVTRIKVVKAPDGTETTDTEIVDTGSSTQDTSLVALKLARKNWVAGIGVQYTAADFKAPDYTVHVARRILGPIFVGASVSTDKTLGVQILGEF